MRLVLSCLGCCLAIVAAAPVSAAEKNLTPAAQATPAAVEKPRGRVAGHSMHGEAFNEGPRQKPYLMGTTGGVHFPIATRVALAQQFFDQGVDQLHGFWYFEAERSFRQVAALDPECAMAYWGLAMANTNNEKRAKKFIETAVKKKATASPREVAWIDALSTWHASADNTERRRKYVRDLEAIVQNNPNDVEAKAFLALQIWQNGSWMTDSKKQLPISSHQAIDAILDQVFAAAPMHPAHHYRIHLWDDEKPARALVSASLCGQASPGIAHMWHMPGHTYSKLHRYADAAWQQEASARVDHAHMMRDQVLPDQIHNYAHNNEWLTRNLSFLGRVNDALELAENLISLPRHPKYNTREKGRSSAGYGHDRLEDLLVRYECWEDLLGERGRPVFVPQKNDAAEKARFARLRGLAHFGLNQKAEGDRQIADLEKLLADERAARIKAAEEAEAKALAANKPEAEVTKVMTDALSAGSKPIRQIERTIAELNVHAALAASDPEKAKAELPKLKKGSSLSDDYRARLHSLAGDHEEAIKLARKKAGDSAGQVYPLATLVEVLHRAGKKDEARAEFDKLRPIAAFADLERRVFQRLKPIAAELGLPEDWRGSQEPAADVGVRPELASLGPFRWAPTPATSWTLAGAAGRDVSLDDYRGQPVVAIFYLGSGCLHCVEQLQKFAPLASEYAAAGISLVGISSEPLDTLAGSLARLSPKETFPFPLAADPTMNVFRSYRCFDEFEDQPLHGVFLIDGEGLVRWHDVSFEPFTDAKFLLEEAKRLLGKS